MDAPTRRKVTLARNGEGRARDRTVREGDPSSTSTCRSNFSTRPNDRVMAGDHAVGVSFSGYSYNERSMLSLAIVDDDVELGNEVTIVWGEEGGGSAKPVVERHVQAEIRAIVSPCPYGEVARTSYADGWRTQAAV
jgi:hypothetical protein